MVKIYDIVTASNVTGYYNEKFKNVDASVGEKAFPARKQLGMKLEYVRGASGRPVALKPAAFDTKVTLRDRMDITLTEEQMPFFKEAVLVKENDRQQFNLLQQTGNQELIDTVTKAIFDDEAHLIASAKARLEAMRMQVLATGVIAIKSNGVMMDFDYGVRDVNKGTVSKAWTETATATPLADIEKAIDALAEIGVTAEVIYLNAKTLAQAKNANSTLALIKPNAPKGAGVTRGEFLEFLEDEYGIKAVVVNGVFTDDEGNAVKMYPDGYVTLAPNASLGSTVFGTTPEESDLMAGNLNGVDVQIVETGVAVTTQQLVDPVNVQTKVSMLALPSFERIDDVYMLDVQP